MPADPLASRRLPASPQLCSVSVTFTEGPAINTKVQHWSIGSQNLNNIHKQVSHLDNSYLTQKFVRHCFSCCCWFVFEGHDSSCWWELPDYLLWMVQIYQKFKSSFSDSWDSRSSLADGHRHVVSLEKDPPPAPSRLACFPLATTCWEHVCRLNPGTLQFWLFSFFLEFYFEAAQNNCNNIVHLVTWHGVDDWEPGGGAHCTDGGGTRSHPASPTLPFLLNLFLLLVLVQFKKRPLLLFFSVSWTHCASLQCVPFLCCVINKKFYDP